MNNINTNSPFQHAFKLSFPILITYMSLGVVFGIIASRLHQPWYFAPLMSLIVYGGAVQFVAIGVMAVQGSLITLFLSTFFVAARNSFYGLSLLKRYDVVWWRKLFLIFTLVDATYAILVTTPEYSNRKQDEKFCLWLNLLMLFYWVAGTFIGSILATHLLKLTELEFIMIAFFVVVVTEQTLKTKKITPLVFAGIASIISFIFFPANMLISAILFCSIAILIGFYWEN